MISAALSSCARSASPPAASETSKTSFADAGFVNRVWKVSKSNAVTTGQLYVFLSEGTLVLASEHGTPRLGVWRYESDGLTMVEDGVSYPTDIVSLTANELVLRSHNPGDVVEITMVPADVPPRTR
jgi:hypothetical protein